MVRDLSKSEKRHWATAMFIPDVADERTARPIIERFRELRGTWFDTGFVVRAFEPFDGIEVRSWWVHDQCELVTAHPDAPDDPVPDVDVDFLQAAVADVRSSFLAVDLARRSDTGEWRVVEVGDGQVSDRPRSTSALEFMRLTVGTLLS